MKVLKTGKIEPVSKAEPFSGIKMGGGELAKVERV